MNTEAVEGPAFTPSVKLLATGLVVALAVFGWRALGVLRTGQWSWPALLLTALGLGSVLLCYVWMLRSRTSIGATHIRQTWITDKQIALADITQIKLIYIRPLAWLVAPRLVIRSRLPGTIVFHAADARVLEVFVRLARSSPPA
ncbi:MAG TPA: hypothetical protein VGP22_17900 [Albitalea sp.]|jgi:hypothetical protein|nr:hypothetical protein [Albitalea sp.]